MFDELDKLASNNAVNARPLADSGSLGPAPVRPVSAGSTGPSVHGQAGALRPAQAEDIFAGIDKSDKPEAFKPQSGIPAARGAVSPLKVGQRSNKILVLGLLVGGLMVVAAGGYFGLRLATSDRPAVNNNNAIIQEEIDNNETRPETSAPAAPVNNPPSDQAATPAALEPLDSDLDGLTDEEEAALGTDPNNSDTDRDGLTDREETEVYNTNALKADSDDDGYKDGEEINSGYNPKGAGKLLEIR